MKNVQKSHYAGWYPLVLNVKIQLQTLEQSVWSAKRNLFALGSWITATKKGIFFLRFLHHTICIHFLDCQRTT